MLAAPAGAPGRDRELLERLEYAERVTAQARGTVADEVSHREADDRSWIARQIIWVFVGVIVAGLGILTWGAQETGEWEDAADQAIDLIKSTVLPVVTLVLGYYFGRSGKG
jgi:hypothetical protein